jgi:hypothetical protein
MKVHKIYIDWLDLKTHKTRPNSPTVKIACTLQELKGSAKCSIKWEKVDCKKCLARKIGNEMNHKKYKPCYICCECATKLGNSDMMIRREPICLRCINTFRKIKKEKRMRVAKL